MKKIKFGVIGCSNISNISMLPAINKSQQSELAVIGSRSIKKAKYFARKFSCENFGSYDDVIKSDVDAIYISLPIGLHEKWAIKAAKAGKHILCEKSSTTSYKSALKMVESCKENNVRIMEGLMFRFHPQHAKVSKIINNNSFGRITSLHGCYALPKMPYDDIRHNKQLGGGILNDAGCYPICASRLTFQREPINVSCYLDIDKKSKVDTFANILLNFNGNQHATLTVGYDLYFQSTYTVLGDKSMLKVERAYNIPDNVEAKIILFMSKKKEIRIKPTNHFVLMINSFCNTINSNSTSKFDFENESLPPYKHTQLRQQYI